jgi:hypothetical protein
VVGVAFGSDDPRWISIRESAVITEDRTLLVAMEFPSIRGSRGLEHVAIVAQIMVNAIQ